ncbi:hypothetical protein V8F06_007365 [Rhypophila decipiens]
MSNMWPIVNPGVPPWPGSGGLGYNDPYYRYPDHMRHLATFQASATAVDPALLVSFPSFFVTSLNWLSARMDSLWPKGPGGVILWLGRPVCGKTTGARYLIWSLNNPYSPKRFVCYFLFCGRGEHPDDRRRKLNHALGAILYQIFTAHPSLTDTGMAAYNWTKAGRGRHGVDDLRAEDLWKVLMAATGTPSYIDEFICVLDSMHECAELDVFCELLNKSCFCLETPTNKRLRFVLTSRPLRSLASLVPESRTISFESTEALSAGAKFIDGIVGSLLRGRGKYETEKPSPLHLNLKGLAQEGIYWAVLVQQELAKIDPHNTASDGSLVIKLRRRIAQDLAGYFDHIPEACAASATTKSTRPVLQASLFARGRNRGISDGEMRPPHLLSRLQMPPSPRSPKHGSNTRYGGGFTFW